MSFIRRPWVEKEGNNFKSQLFVEGVFIVGVWVKRHETSWRVRQRWVNGRWMLSEARALAVGGDRHGYRWSRACIQGLCGTPWNWRHRHTLMISKAFCTHAHLCILECVFVHICVCLWAERAWQRTHPIGHICTQTLIPNTVPQQTRVPVSL